MASQAAFDLEDYYNRVAQLHPVEIVWRDRQEYLASRGYLLRARYRPGWIASWKLDPSIQKPFYAEDFPMAHLLRPSLMDATRVSDGKLVVLKQVPTDSQELKIATHLSSRELRKDPRNHCVSVLDVFPDKDDPSNSYLVMPFMRYVDDPPFESVQDMLDCGEQLLEGLVFLHEQGIAHRDCAYKNVMMDTTAMYPQGFHPIRSDFLPHDLQRLSPVLSRNQVPVTYYFVDFGISSWFHPDEHERLVLGTTGLDKDVPELSNEVPYDPFKVDSFVLGNMFRENFTAKYTNLDFLTPLLFQMTNEADALVEAKSPTRDSPSVPRDAVSSRTSAPPGPRDSGSSDPVHAGAASKGKIQEDTAARGNSTKKSFGVLVFGVSLRSERTPETPSGRLRIR